jgi:DNA polymerase bacteriophage-type
MLFFDLEVYSDVSINDVPFDVYVNHPSTKIVLACAAFDDKAVVAWQTPEEVEEFVQILRTYQGPLNAWNVSYERSIIGNNRYGVKTDLSRWTDTMVLARQVGLPGALKKCVTVPELRVPVEDQTKSETALIKRFCMPYEMPKKFAKKPAEFDAETASQWAQFVRYCEQDVLSTRHIYNYLIKNFVFDEQEVGVWQLDQLINERGLPIDVVTATHAAEEVKRILSEKTAVMAKVTGLENPNSVRQLLPWLQARGYRHDSLGKEYVQAAVEREADRLTPECREVLAIRLDTSKSSVKKFAAMLEGTSPDGRYRNGYRYAGAHTLRWSGRGFQPQNLVRAPTIEEELNRLVRHEPATSLDDMSTCIRPMIQASPGKKLGVADLSAIENRALMWMSGCETGLQVYADGRDPYKDFGVRLLGKKYEEITKQERQFCKPAVLGGGYGLGAGQEKHLANGTIEFTGLRGYAEGMDIYLTQEQSQSMINTFRKEFRDVVDFWRYLESAFYAAVCNPNERQQVGYLHFGAVQDGYDILAVYIELPSGRRIHYMNPRAWKGAKGIEIRFDGLRNGQWWSVSTWGGSLCENVVQAVSRDVLVVGMQRAEADNITVVGHSHDELITEVDLRFPCLRERLEYAMSEPIDWAPGLPLAAEGSEMDRYAKG